MPKYGTFKELEDIIRRDDPREFPKLSCRLRKAPNNEFRYKIMKRHPHGVTVLLHKIEKPFKDEKSTKIARMDGNAEFKKKDYRAACQKYTESLLHAATSKCLAVIYANRSSAKFHLMKYFDSLKDIERAFEHGYQEVFPNKVKLLDERKGRCLEKLGQASEAIVVYKKVLKLYEDEMNGLRCDEFKDKIAICETNIASKARAMKKESRDIKGEIDKMDFLDEEEMGKIKEHFDSQQHKDESESPIVESQVIKKENRPRSNFQRWS